MFLTLPEAPNSVHDGFVRLINKLFVLLCFLMDLFKEYGFPFVTKYCFNNIVCWVNCLAFLLGFLGLNKLYFDIFSGTIFGLYRVVLFGG